MFYCQPQAPSYFHLSEFIGTPDLCILLHSLKGTVDYMAHLASSTCFVVNSAVLFVCSLRLFVCRLSCVKLPTVALMMLHCNIATLLQQYRVNVAKMLQLGLDE